MTVLSRILAGLALVAITIVLVGAADSTFAGPSPLGAPGPIAGAGLPILAVGFGVYWLVKRFRRKTD
jgi:hypothetical protein